MIKVEIEWKNVFWGLLILATLLTFGCGNSDDMDEAASEKPDGGGNVSGAIETGSDMGMGGIGVDASTAPPAETKDIPDSAPPSGPDSSTDEQSDSGHGIEPPDSSVPVIEPKPGIDPEILAPCVEGAGDGADGMVCYDSSRSDYEYVGRSAETIGRCWEGRCCTMGCWDGDSCQPEPIPDDSFFRWLGRHCNNI